ncbi:alpha/beta-hydrolase family protein [Nocardioides sp. YIM 152588]|uniref:alpha/beta hydrolase n=1 Tax=Nocardioides sp. YIM 152588 TaxID=3158259 RepID=UPI0032E4613B
MGETDTPRPRPLARARRWLRPLPAGVLGGVLLACLSLTPSLLPRPALTQGVLTGVTAAIGYGVGLVVGWCWRGLRGRPRSPWPAWAVRALALGGAAAGLLALSLGAWWQEEAHRLAGTEPTPVAFVLLVPPIAAATAVLLVAIARGVRVGTRRLVALLERLLNPSAARVLGVLLAGALAWGLVTGVIADRGLAALDASFSLRDGATPPGAVRPSTPLRSGSDASLVAWDSLGREGRAFVGRGPDAEQIEDATGRPASEPIRVYAGLDSAEDVEDRAALAVDDLVRAGGLERSRILVVSTTGTGWVEPSAAAGFEYVAGGDSAIVAIQYSYLPSWLSFLVDAERAREASRTLFDTLYARLSALPAADRPELYVFGESLGSYGGEVTFSGDLDLANRTSGALFVGPPHANPLYRRFVDGRDPGSPEIEPIYRDGRIVRFTTTPEPPPPTDRPWPGTRVLYLQHASDPVTWWSPELLLSRPDWLEEPPGDDVPGAMVWLPLVTFLQVSGDFAGAFATQPAHGHNFSGEHAAAWVSVMQPEGWTEEMTERLRVELRRVP